ncbi:putative nuclease HARBI1 [Gigantopelta aegis]|uniref:putative nuclease HARBI1 n=1 Tax=Gigantopelta aegis TaxID=1735272 RepID=UPI001B88ABBD|nr:putative nuclease HARBI1 [Gigantopelta aegis]
MPVVLLGDAAYPMKNWLLKPYTNQMNLTVSQNVFNYKLSRARMTIENTFGRLKGRWRCLQKRLDVGVEFASTVVTACAILHNLCELRNEPCVFVQVEENGDEMDGMDTGEEAQVNATILRNDLAAYFVND